MNINMPVLGEELGKLFCYLGEFLWLFEDYATYCLLED